MMNIQQPIVLIGAGRSGTTLLTRLFDQHPDIDFRGETSFLLPRLWLELWEDRFWFNWRHYTDMNPRSSCEQFPTISNDVLEQTRKNTGNILAHAIVDVLSIDTQVYKVWGYKEIWNGSSQFQYDWLPYHIVFPEAIWVHLIRNPFGFIESCANWNNEKLTLSYAQDRLIDWVSIIKHSRKLIPTGRYFEVHYEDLIAKPREVLQPIFERVNLTWHAGCEDALKNFVLRSPQKPNNQMVEQESADVLEPLIHKCVDAAAIMKELDYRVPETIRIRQDDMLQESPRITDLHTRGTQLSQPHQPQLRLSWQLYELNQEHQRLQSLYQELMQQYQDVTTSETFRLAQAIQQSWLMKASRLLRKWQ